MSGAIGYTGTNGNTAAQVIASLRKRGRVRRHVPGRRRLLRIQRRRDPLRARESEWQYTEPQLTARGIPWVQENSTTPQNRNAVLGATCGAAALTLPNGSIYLPGSWADNLTSYGCDFSTPNQTKATAFIAAGAAGTTGAVVEPYAIPQRFTNSSIDTFIADGSTLGEAFAKSVATPDIQMPLGDMLAQPFADVPEVAITSSPGNYGTVRGTISVGGSASLASPRIATGIAQLELLVDGVVSPSSTMAGASATFSLSTTGLSDGVHEVRVVAVNNAEAASEGYSAEPIVVDNHGRCINYNGGNTTFATLAAAAATFNLAETAGDGAISQVELTCLGRVVAQAGGAATSLSLSPTALAPGDNTIVPVAVFSDGTQTAGGAFVVHVGGGTVNGWTNSTGWGLWSLPGDWSGGAMPQNVDGVARFGGGVGGSTVTVDVSPILQEVDFDGSGGGSYALLAAPGQKLTLSTSSGPLGESLINVLSGTHSISAPVVLVAPGNLVNVTNPADCLTIGGISGPGALTKTGAGLLFLAGSNTYVGTTTISGGTLQLAPGGTLGPAPVIDNSVLEVNRPDTFTLANSIGGVGALSQNGGGTLVIAGTNSYSGGTRVEAGNIVFASARRHPGRRNDPACPVRGIERDRGLFDRHRLAQQRQDQHGVDRRFGDDGREQ